MSSSRTNVLSTKVTDEEYAELERAAGTQLISTWARDVLLRAARQHHASAAVLAEVVALRTLMLNLHYAHATGAELTPGRMRELIALVDQGRFARAAARLKESAAGGSR